jgi:hypothetical protein
VRVNASAQQSLLSIREYVLVEAEDEAQARELGQAALLEQHAELRRRLGRDVRVNNLDVRPATSDEIEFCRWREAMLAQERATKARLTRHLASTIAQGALIRGLASRLDVRFATSRRLGGPPRFGLMPTMPRPAPSQQPKSSTSLPQPSGSEPPVPSLRTVVPLTFAKL